MSIFCIDFHIDNHLIQVGHGMLLVFKDGNTQKPPIEFEAAEIARILRVATEQLDDADGNYADAI